MARWIQVNTDLPRHRKTARLMAALRLTSWEAVGALTHFWMAIREQAPDGSLERFTPQDVHAMTGLQKGNPAATLPALISCGFVDVQNGSEQSRTICTVHDWDEHAGKQLRDAERMRVYRAQRKLKDDRKLQESRTVRDNTGGSGSGSGIDSKDKKRAANTRRVPVLTISAEQRTAAAAKYGLEPIWIEATANRIEAEAAAGKYVSAPGALHTWCANELRYRREKGNTTGQNPSARDAVSTHPDFLAGKLERERVLKELCP